MVYFEKNIVNDELKKILSKQEWKSDTKGSPKQYLKFLKDKNLERLCKLNFVKKLLTRKERVKAREAKKLELEKIRATQEKFKAKFPNCFIRFKNLKYEDIDNLDLGEYSYSSPIDLHFLNAESRLKIGRFCSIADEVKILCGGEHFYKGLTTFAITPYITPFKTQNGSNSVLARVSTPPREGGNMPLSLKITTALRHAQQF